jgi:hypothetical protein
MVQLFLGSYVAGMKQVRVCGGRSELHDVVYNRNVIVCMKNP